MIDNDIQINEGDQDATKSFKAIDYKEVVLNQLDKDVRQKQVKK